MLFPSCPACLTHSHSHSHMPSHVPSRTLSSGACSTSCPACMRGHETSLSCAHFVARVHSHCAFLPPTPLVCSLHMRSRNKHIVCLFHGSVCSDCLITCVCPLVCSLAHPPPFLTCPLPLHPDCMRGCKNRHTMCSFHGPAHRVTGYFDLVTPSTGMGALDAHLCTGVIEPLTRAPPA